MQSGHDAQALASRVGFDPDYLEAFEQKLFIHGPQTARRLTNFFVLLLLASVIATYGVLSSSVATVIGAMIVAPLMGPIMAMAAAVVMGSTQRALRSLALVALGVFAVILLSMALTWLVPDVSISFTENAEIASRISPGLIALLTALAAGAAGAYITAREEIADSMGGVAIAISLVPPLCVVGISINQGRWDAALGALTLFLTNFLAILLAGGVTFVLVGLGRLAVTTEHVRVRRNAFVLIVIATLLVAIPLSVTSYRSVDAALESRKAAGDVSRWLAGTSHQAVRTTVTGPDVTVVIVGNGELRPLQQLADSLAGTLGRPVTVELRDVPAQRQASSGGTP
jgi:uncharacterized hydrophobic protein (TIGR00271 family)